MSLLARNRGFARAWAGQTVSLFGDQVTAIALPLIAVVALDLPTWQVSTLTAAAWAPYLLALPIGALTDRYPLKRHLLIASDLVRAGVLLTLPLAAWLGGVQYAQLLAVPALMGLAGVVAQTSYTSFFVRLVPSEDVIAANALSSTSRSVASLAGPPVGGLLVQLLRAPLAVVVDAASYLVSAGALAGLRVPDERAEPAGRRRLAAEIREGVVALFADRLRLRILACVATINVTSFAILAVVMVFLARVLRLSGGTIGIAQGAGALGALVGALAAPRLVRRLGLFPVAATGVIAGAAPYVGLAGVAASLPVGARAALVALALAGVSLGQMLFDIPINAVLLRTTPDALRGRIVGAFTTLNYGMRPFGALLGGLLGQTLGVRWTIAAAGLTGCVALLPLALSPLRGVRELAEIPDANASVPG